MRVSQKDTLLKIGFVMITLLIILLFCSMSICAANNDKPFVVYIDLAQAAPIKASDIFKSIEYIPLELNDQGILKDYPQLFLDKKHIVTINLFENAHLFDRKTGKHIREISKKGEGPDEYRWHPVAVDKRYNYLIAENAKNWVYIDIEKNKAAFVVEKPERRYKASKEHQGIIRNPYLYRKDTFLGYTNNVTGTYPHQLILFKADGEVIQTYPNYIFYEKKGREVPSGNGYFYEVGEHTYFKCFPSDTVYRVEKEGLKPHIIFHIKGNEKELEYETMTVMGQSIVIEKTGKNHSRIMSVRETKNLIFFGLKTGESPSRSCYYDKRTGKTYIGDNNYVNDIDGLPPFRVQDIHNGNEIAAGYNAETLFKHRNAKGLSAKGKKLVEQIEEDDNPVVIIARLKE